MLTILGIVALVIVLIFVAVVFGLGELLLAIFSGILNVIGSSGGSSSSGGSGGGSDKSSGGGFGGGDSGGGGASGDF